MLLNLKKTRSTAQRKCIQVYKAEHIDPTMLQIQRSITNISVFSNCLHHLNLPGLIKTTLMEVLKLESFYFHLVELFASLQLSLITVLYFYN